MPTFNTVEELVRILDSNPELLEALRARLLTRELLELPQRFSEFAAASEQRFENIERTLKQHGDDIGQLKGIGLENRLHNRGISHVATLFRMRNNRRVRMAERDGNSVEFNNRMYEAEESGVLTEEEYNRLLDTDMIVLGNRRGSSSDVYVPIEASFSVSMSDIEKVKLSAEVLGKIFPDAEIYPALYFMNIPEWLVQVAEDEEIGLMRVENLGG